jgi:metal-responsive CopG/Arc/MetJ family transcriptional regulator
MKKKQKSLSICIEPEVDKLLEEGGYNKSKLINKLLEVYLKKESIKTHDK